MLGYAQRVVCHARAAANVAEDEDVDRDGLVRGPCSRSIVFGDAEDEARDDGGQTKYAKKEG